MVLGSRTATILPRLTFSTFFFASHSSAHCSKGRAAACLCLSSCFSVLGSLPSLSRSFALSRAPRVGERERAILAVAVRADGVGFLAAVEAVAHPPELGGSVAGPALVRRDEEIRDRGQSRRKSWRGSMRRCRISVGRRGSR